MQTQIAIRRFDPARDAAALRECVIDHQDYHRGLEPSWPGGAAIADDYIAYLDTACARYNGCVFIAADERAAAGFVCVLASTSGASPDDPAPHAWIQDVFVKPSYRRRGVASLLMREAERFARDQGARELRLGVLDRNADARAFHAAHGFREYTHVLTKSLR